MFFRCGPALSLVRLVLEIEFNRNILNANAFWPWDCDMAVTFDMKGFHLTLHWALSRDFRTSAMVEYQGLRPCEKLRIRRLSDSIVQQKVNKLWLEGGEIVAHCKRHSGPLEQRGVQTEKILPQSHKGRFSRLVAGYSNIRTEISRSRNLDS